MSNEDYQNIFNAYVNYVYTIAQNRLKSVATKEDVEECVSDIFAEFFKYLQTKELAESEYKNMLSVIAKRRSVDYFRKLSRHINQSEDIEAMEQVLCAEDNVELSMEKKEESRRLWDEIKKLKEPDYSIIIFQYIYGYSLKRIADMLSMTNASVEKRSQRARKKLREGLQDFYEKEAL